MTTSSSTLARLEHETSAHHGDAATPWLALLAAGVPRVAYVDHLIAIYGFEAPLEAALALTPHVRLVLQLRARARAGRIVQDLLALDLTASQIARLPQCASIALFRDAAEALAWTYVVERTTRLHDPVRREVMRRHAPAACAYLSTTASDVEARWHALGEALDRIAETSEIVDEIVEAAHEAFACQRAWFLGEPRAARRGARA